MSDEDHSYHHMNAQAREAFRFLVSVVNVQAFDEGSQAAAAWFLSWDTLEDLMPFFSYNKARAYIMGSVFEYMPNAISKLYPIALEHICDSTEEPFDEVYKLYVEELCKDLNLHHINSAKPNRLYPNSAVWTLHEPIFVPHCLPTARNWMAKDMWQKFVGYVDFESYETRKRRTSHQFRAHHHIDGGDSRRAFNVSFEFRLPVVYISHMPSDCTTAAVEALMPNHGSTVVRVEYRSLPSWNGMLVEFESFAALDDTMETHRRKPFVMSGVPLEMTLEMVTERPCSPPSSDPD